jgi:hypothetical protein
MTACLTWVVGQGSVHPEGTKRPSPDSRTRSSAYRKTNSVWQPSLTTVRQSNVQAPICGTTNPDTDLISLLLYVNTPTKDRHLGSLLSFSPKRSPGARPGALEDSLKPRKEPRSIGNNCQKPRSIVRWRNNTLSPRARSSLKLSSIVRLGTPRSKLVSDRFYIWITTLC